MKIVCPHCQVKGTAAEGLLGKKVRCPDCSNVFRVSKDVTVEVPPVEEVVVATPEAESTVDEIVATEPESAPFATDTEVAEEADEADDETPDELPEGVEACSKCGFVFSDKYIEKQDTISFCTLCALRPPLDEDE